MPGAGSVLGSQIEQCRAAGHDGRPDRRTVQGPADDDDSVSKSTASHHFKTLREAGVTERSMRAGQSCQHLRSDEVERALPGVLSAILGAVEGPS